MPDHDWLIVRLEAPLLAFGGAAIDHMGITRDFPAASMLTGLLANAMGWRRTDWQAHQALQDRLIFGVSWEREDKYGVLTDTQNVHLDKNDKGWTTWAEPEGRDGNSYDGPHRRFRDYHADASLILALRLADSEDGPSLETLAAVLDRPVRPLFIGRKPCLPSAPLRQKDFVTAATAYAALQNFLRQGESSDRLRALWPLGEGPSEGDAVHRIIDLADIRNWRTGLHGGTRPIVEGVLPPEAKVAA